MARSATTTYTDDFDNTEIQPDDLNVISFGYQGCAYELDLNPENAQRVREHFSGLVAAARKVDPVRGNRRGRKEEARMIRRWAEDRGFEVPKRGRLPERILSAYRDEAENKKK